MKDIVIYKSINNGLGGNIDTTNNFTVFPESSNYCCLYIKNESLSKNKILSISVTSLDVLSIAVVLSESSDIAQNQLSDLSIVDSLSFETSILFNDFVLPSGYFFNIWLKKEDTTNYTSKRNLNISVEYINEY